MKPLRSLESIDAVSVNHSEDSTPDDTIPRSSPFSPLARAVMDGFRDGVVVFDPEGRFVYANADGQKGIELAKATDLKTAEDLMPPLAKLGGRVAPLRVGGMKVGEAVFLPATPKSPKSLADHERNTIEATLDATGWKLAEAARKLGISRTTLWRRLKEYGLDRNGRGRLGPVQDDDPDTDDSDTDDSN